MAKDAVVLKGLDAATVRALLGKSRNRNAYAPKLVEFDSSDEAAVDVKANWPLEFGEKSAATLYQGFRKAAEAAKDEKNPKGILHPDGYIMVKQTDGNVYLIHAIRAGVMDTEDDDSDAENE